MQTKICAVILAAGEGRRFGEPKAFAKIDEVSFLNLSVEKLCSTEVCEVSVVVKNKINLNFNKLKEVINSRQDAPMLSSVYEGIKNSVDADGYLIYPVDYPFIKKSTLDKLISEFGIHSESVILPVYNNKKGHPVIIPKSIAVKINGEDVDGGLDALIKNSDAEICLIGVNDDGILRNINYKSDL